MAFSCVHVYVQIPPFDKNIIHVGLVTLVPLQDDLTLTKYIYNDPISK